MHKATISTKMNVLKSPQIFIESSIMSETHFFIWNVCATRVIHCASTRARMTFPFEVQQNEWKLLSSTLRFAKVAAWPARHEPAILMYTQPMTIDLFERRFSVWKWKKHNTPKVAYNGLHWSMAQFFADVVELPIGHQHFVVFRFRLNNGEWKMLSIDCAEW